MYYFYDNYKIYFTTNVLKIRNCHVTIYIRLIYAMYYWLFNFLATTRFRLSSLDFNWIWNFWQIITQWKENFWFVISWCYLNAILIFKSSFLLKFLNCDIDNYVSDISLFYQYNFCDDKRDYRIVHVSTRKLQSFLYLHVKFLKYKRILHILYTLLSRKKERYLDLLYIQTYKEETENIFWIAHFNCNG